MLALTQPTILVTDSLAEVEIFLNRYNNPKTREPYRNGLKRFYDFLIAKNITSLDSVTLELLQEFKLKLEGEFSPKTCSMTIGHVKEFFKFLTYRGHLRLNQAVLLKPTAIAKREQKTEVMTEAEVRKVFRLIYNMPSDNYSNSLKVMFIIFINAGLRKEEMATLKLSAFKLQSGCYTITILGKGSKYRFVSISEQATNELKALFEALSLKPDDYVIQAYDNAGIADNSKPLSGVAISKRVNKLIYEARIERDITPHSLRRTCATIMYKRNVPIETIQRFLGHDNITTTQGYIAMEADVEMSAKHALNLVHTKEV